MLHSFTYINQCLRYLFSNGEEFQIKGTFLAAVLTVAVVSLGLYGCGGSTTTETATDEHADHVEHGEHDHGDRAHHNGDGQSDMEKMKAELAKLSLEDAASAEKQHFCPASGEMLGAMVPPIQMDVRGRTVWLCCDDCRESLLSNPEEYLGKLSKE